MFRIRCVVDDAERFLTQPEIYAGLAAPRPTRAVFAVTIAIMTRAKQLRRRKATTALRARFPGVHSVYGPAAKPVYDGRAAADRPRRMVGFMEAKRMREAKRRARRVAA